ncbi:MAG: molybdenum cofactor biosynthesis enzyme [Eggerthellaceae bacterium]|nr:molybdenum cofactor biosynthesis enzyme [Eggerthellaceae bacterium]
MKRGLFVDERGFTTTSMVLSLLITLSLLFTAAQVYRIQSASAEVQDVADASALAAQNQVAEFMILVRFCDAAVLSLSLTGLVVTGLGVAALCTPVTAELSEALIEAGKRIISARNTFSERSSKALEKLQEALPYFSAACAASVAAANNADSSGANYLGCAILVPFEGEPIEADVGKKAEELAEDVEGEADEIREDAERAEEAAQEAEKCKLRAFMRDCGDNPDYCMYERAFHLAGMTGLDNPLYESVDAWSFSVALNRAQSYYSARLAQEVPESPSVGDQARSALREHFYRYANELMAEGFVVEDEDSFEAYFPRLPSNTSEMRSTSLYTDSVYPVTEDVEQTVSEYEEGGEVITEVLEESYYVMHAWSGCPLAGAPIFYGSISQLEAGDFRTCPACEFGAASMGKVAAASTSVPNGFEYHYRALADEAEAYEKARREAQEPKEKVERSVGELFDELVEALKETAGKRISSKPPGSYGAIAFVVNAGSTSTSGGFASSFVPGGASLGPRAAVAAATLVDEGSAEGRTVLNSALDNLKEGGGFAVGAAGMVLDAWSWLVVAYSNGQSALADAIEEGLNGLPLVGASGLGTWAAGKLEGAIEAVGLQPTEVGALKPVLVNSGHVAAKGDGQAAGLLSAKRLVVAHPLMSTDLFSSILTDAERVAIQQVEGLGDTLEIASIELLGEGGPSIPVTIPIPEPAKAYAVSAIQGLFGRVRSYYIETSGVRVWE